LKTGEIEGRRRNLILKMRLH